MKRIRKVTCDLWRNVPAGTTVPDGFGGERTAPAAPGLYTLYELADAFNVHQGWQWERHSDGLAEDDHGTWYAVLMDDEDTDWGTGSRSLDEAKAMAARMGAPLIAVIEDGPDPVCVQLIYLE